jgi:hypothetical protein
MTSNSKTDLRPYGRRRTDPSRSPTFAFGAAARRGPHRQAHYTLAKTLTVGGQVKYGGCLMPITALFFTLLPTSAAWGMSGSSWPVKLLEAL